MRITKKTKKISILILFILGFGLSFTGINKIINTGETKYQEIDLDEIKKFSQNTPEKLPIIFLKPPYYENNMYKISNVTILNVDFETRDIFSTHNTIKISTKATLLDPNIITSAYLVRATPNYPDHYLTQNNFNAFLDFQNSISSLIKLNKTGYGFSGEQYGSYEAPQQVALFLVLNKTDGLIEWIPLQSRQGILEIRPYDDLLQLETNKITIKQIEQDQINSKEQRKSNDIMEGLTWIILAVVFIEPAFRLWSSISSSNTRLE